MSGNKLRITVTLDPDMVKAGNAAVRAGRAASLSDWVNSAARERASEEKRLSAARRAVAAWDRELGAMTKADVEARVRTLRENAIRVRPTKRRASSRRAA